MKYEYLKACDVDIDTLNDLGEGGWELVSVLYWPTAKHTLVFYFKHLIK